MATLISLNPVKELRIPNIFWESIKCSESGISIIEVRKNVPIAAILSFISELNPLEGIKVKAPIKGEGRILEIIPSTHLLVVREQEDLYVSVLYCEVIKNEIDSELVPISDKFCCNAAKDMFVQVQYQRFVLVSRIIVSSEVPKEILRNFCKVLVEDWKLTIDYDEETNIIEMLDKDGNFGLICIDHKDFYSLSGVNIEKG